MQTPNQQFIAGGPEGPSKRQRINGLNNGQRTYYLNCKNLNDYFQIVSNDPMALMEEKRIKEEKEREAMEIQREEERKKRKAMEESDDICPPDFDFDSDLCNYGKTIDFFGLNIAEGFWDSDELDNCENEDCFCNLI